MTRDEWREALAAQGMGDESIEEVIAITFGDSEGDVVILDSPPDDE
ncbi:MAG: hypothetical protein AAF791_14700 [Bacteroidota bacterium]